MHEKHRRFGQRASTGSRTARSAVAGSGSHRRRAEQWRTLGQGRPDRGHGLLMQAGGDGLAAAGRGWRDLMCGVAGVGDADTMAEQE